MSNSTKKKGYYLPTILLGVIVAVIFLMAIFTYQVAATEKALVLTMGKITAVTGPGLHFRLPLPFQEVIKYDCRKRCFDGRTGALEETTTRDARQVVVGINVFYYIEDLERFKTAASLTAAEDFLGSRMRTAKASVIGKYNYDQLINIDPAKMKLEQMKAEMLALIAPEVFERYGLKVFAVKFATIGVPENTANAIASRMKQERLTEADKQMKEGETQAQKIRSDADKAKRETITLAQAEAKKIMAEGDAKAAKALEIFSEEPRLAAFLQKLDSLGRILRNKSTLVLDTKSAPFDLLSSFSLDGKKDSLPGQKDK